MNIVVDKERLSEIQYALGHAMVALSFIYRNRDKFPGIENEVLHALQGYTLEEVVNNANEADAELIDIAVTSKMRWEKQGGVNKAEYLPKIGAKTKEKCQPVNSTQLTREQIVDVLKSIVKRTKSGTIDWNKEGDDTYYFYMDEFFTVTSYWKEYSGISYYEFSFGEHTVFSIGGHRDSYLRDEELIYLASEVFCTARDITYKAQLEMKNQSIRESDARLVKLFTEEEGE